MKLSELLAVAGIGALVATTSCTTTNDVSNDRRVYLSSLERIDVSSYVGTKTQVESLSERYSLSIWQISDSSGNVAGYWSSGRMEGLHFRQLSTDERFISEYKFQGPKLPEGYRATVLKE